MGSSKTVRDQVLALLRRRTRMGWTVMEVAAALGRDDAHIRRELGDLRALGLARCETLRVKTKLGMRPRKIWHVVEAA